MKKTEYVLAVALMSAMMIGGCTGTKSDVPVATTVAATEALTEAESTTAEPEMESTETATEEEITTAAEEMKQETQSVENKKSSKETKAEVASQKSAIQSAEKEPVKMNTAVIEETAALAPVTEESNAAQVAAPSSGADVQPTQTAEQNLTQDGCLNDALVY